MEKVINGVLDHGRVTPVVLGQDEYEGGVGLDFQTPGPRQWVRVGFVGFDLRGDEGFVEEGEGPAVEVYEVEVCGGGGGGGGGGEAVRDGGVYEGADLGADAGLARGAEDDAD